MKHPIIIVGNSSDYECNDVVVEIHWRNKKGQLKRYIHKKTESDKLAIDYKVYDITSSKNIGLV